MARTGKRHKVTRDYVYDYDEEQDALSVFFAVPPAPPVPPTPPAATITPPSAVAVALIGATAPAAAYGREAAAGASCRAAAAPAVAPAPGSRRGAPFLPDLHILSPIQLAAARALGPLRHPELRSGPGWHALGDHPCGEDLYHAAYRFAFRGTELAELETAFYVQGPEKEYLASTVYTR